MQNIIENKRSNSDYFDSLSRIELNRSGSKYNLKDQLDELTGNVNFSKTLEEVNLIIGVFVFILLVFFFNY